MFFKEKFLVIKTIGGLGNQIFQFCFGIIISKLSSRVLVIDETSFLVYNKFRPLLKEILNDKYTNKFNKNNYLIKLCARLKIFAKVFQDKNFYNVLKKDIDYLTESKSLILVLDGYWQTFKLLDELKSEDFLDFFSKKLSKDLKKKETSVCMHIRRGDYYNDTKIKNIHGILGTSYFEDAIKKFESKFNNDLSYYIYSDDIEFCKKINYLKNKKNIYFIETGSEVENFAEMSNYNNYILSNSTFGLFAAYISARKKGCVNTILPCEWIKNTKTNQTGLISNYFRLI